MSTFTKANDLKELIALKEQYVTRLDVGAARIEEERARGKNVYEWEDYWLGMLKEYEAVCDQVRKLEAEEAEAQL